MPALGLDSSESTLRAFRCATASCQKAMPTAMKYNTTIGMASRNIDITSAAGVAIAVNTQMSRMATRQALRMPRAERMPMKLSSTMNTGSTNATPMASTSFSTKLEVVLGLDEARHPRAGRTR